MLLPALYAFLLGAVLGSFITVVAHRVPRGEQFVSGRSRCPACGVDIPARDNIPILSWMLLRGKARCCGARISVRYPLTELALGILFAAAVLVLYEDLTRLVLALGLFMTLAAVTITDLEHRIIPNKILIASAAFALAAGTAIDPSGEPERLIAAVAAGALLLLAAILYPRGMGMGDVKLIAVMGLYLGRGVAPALLIALAAGALVGIGMMIVRGRAARKAAIPFGPFLALGGAISALWGDELVDAYLNTFSQ